MTPGLRASCLGVIVAGVLLRALHLGTPGLWFDEIVEIRTAQHASVAEVLAAVRGGARPTAGNAGAMPLDYLVQHAWFRFTPDPSRAWIEVHHRMPAFLASCLTLLALGWLVRSTLGAREALVAVTLLAGAVWHVMYAAEARFHALLGLVTTLEIGAFAALLDAPTRRSRQAAFAIAVVASLLTGVYAVVLVGGQSLALLAVMPRRRVRVVAIAGVACLLAAWWLGPVGLATRHGRPVPEDASSLRELVNALRVFAGGSTVLAGVYGTAIPAGVWAVWRRGHASRALALVQAGAVLSIPALAWLAWRKGYYLHPRHVLFVMVPLCWLVAAMLVALADRVWPTRPWWSVAILTVGLVALEGSAIASWVRDPLVAVRQVKGPIELGRAIRVVADRVDALSAGERLLVLVERNAPGFMANLVVRYYLHAFDLDDRVVLRGFADLRMLATRLRTQCPNDCRGPFGPAIEAALDIGPFAGRPPDIPRFLRLDDGPGNWPATVGGVVVFAYSDFRTWDFPGLVRTLCAGLAVYVPVAQKLM